MIGEQHPEQRRGWNFEERLQRAIDERDPSKLAKLVRTVCMTAFGEDRCPEVPLDDVKAFLAAIDRGEDAGLVVHLDDGSSFTMATDDGGLCCTAHGNDEMKRAWERIR